MKKLEYIWLSREKGDMRDYATAWEIEPHVAQDSLGFAVYRGEGDLFETEYKLMRRIFGITLRPGQCRRINIEVSE